MYVRPKRARRSKAQSKRVAYHNWEVSNIIPLVKPLPPAVCCHRDYRLTASNKSTGMALRRPDFGSGATPKKGATGNPRSYIRQLSEDQKTEVKEAFDLFDIEK